MPLAGPSHWVPDPAEAPRLREITVAALLDEATARRPNAEALVATFASAPGPPRRLTYAQLRAAARRVAAALIADGLGRGDAILIWAPNVGEHVLLHLGAAYANVATIPTNPLYRRDDLAYVLDRARPATVLLMPTSGDGSSWEVYRNALGVATHRPAAVALGPTPTPAPEPTWDAWLDRGRSVADTTIDARIDALRPDDLAQIQFTSGTTGRPKGVRLPHRLLANQGIQIAHRAGMDETARFVNPMPLFHCGGCVVVALATLAVAGTHLPIVRFDPAEICATIERERATLVAGVPTMLIAIEEQERATGHDLRSLETVVSGGAPVPTDLGHRWQQRLGVAFAITYGQTEFAPVACFSGPTDRPEQQIGTVGRPLGHVELDVVVPGADARVATGDEGELRYRGYVMEGYHEDPAATARAVTADGWLRSGDLGTIDADGYVRITGRAKEMIIRGGENIAPAAVEDAVRTVDGVADVCVIGVPDERYGEELCAFVRPAPGHERLTIAAIRAALDARVARYRIPRYLVTVEHLPLTPSGKVQRFRLAELYAEARAAGRVQDARTGR